MGMVHTARRKAGPARLAVLGGVVLICLSVSAVGCGTVSPGGHERSGIPPTGTQEAKVPARGALADPAATAAALARGRWSVLAASPLGSRQAPVVAWTGAELLEIGGMAGGIARSDGAAFDPAQRRWHRIAPVPGPVGTAAAASVWTGSQLFVFGVQAPPGKTAAGPAAGLYDPGSGRWAVSATAPFGRQALQQPAVVWTGRLVIVAGLDHTRVEAASYDPTAGTWQRQDPPLPQAHPALGIAMVATADRVILWSLWGRFQQTAPFAGYSGVDVRALAGGRWHDVTGDWPQHHTVPPPLFTGTQILIPPGQIWCGACSHPAPAGEHAWLADPGTLRLTPLSPGPLDDLGPLLVWTGRAVISINPGGQITGPHVSVQPGDMAAWDPASGHWRRLPRAPRLLQYDATPAWTGQELLAIAADGALLGFGKRASPGG